MLFHWILSWSSCGQRLCDNISGGAHSSNTPSHAALPTWRLCHQSNDKPPHPPWQHDLSKITSSKSGDFPIVVFLVGEGSGGDGAATIWHFSHRKWCECSPLLHVINEQRVLPRALPKSQSTLAVSQMLHNSIWESLRSETIPRLQNEPQSCCTMLSVPSTIWDLGCFVFVCYYFVSFCFFFNYVDLSKLKLIIWSIKSV